MKHVENETDWLEMSAVRVPSASPDPSNASELRMDEEYIDLGPYVLAVVDQWRMIVMVAVAAAGITALVAGLLMSKWYRASAIIRPVSISAVQSRMAGISSGGLAGRLSAIALYFGGSANSGEAQEYMTILQSFAFNVHLAKHHKLVGRLLGRDPSPGTRGSDWAVYSAMRRRFRCKYSLKTENITLEFEARDRREAETVLGYYIDHLRALLRAREIRDANAAVASLEVEADSTPDPLLRSQLYELAAKQIERKDTAKVEADFSFRVLAPPAASDRPYRPRVLFDSLIAAILAALAMSMFVIKRFHSHRTRRV